MKLRISKCEGTYHFNTNVKDCFVGKLIATDLMDSVKVIAMSAGYKKLAISFIRAICIECRESL